MEYSGPTIPVVDQETKQDDQEWSNIEISFRPANKIDEWLRIE